MTFQCSCSISLHRLLNWDIVSGMHFQLAKLSETWCHGNNNFKNRNHPSASISSLVAFYSVILPKSKRISFTPTFITCFYLEGWLGSAKLNSCIVPVWIGILTWRRSNILYCSPTADIWTSWSPLENDAANKQEQE